MIIRADNEDKKLVIRKKDSKLYINICLNLLTIIWLHEIDFIIKYNGVLAEHTIKKSLDNYCLNVSMETIFIIRENTETN